ncbi:MAG: hypothetical protein K2Q01_05490 [Rickettsiales bacterium]|nr:hypothetical protein [Rickettsiales bacterium]
MKQDYAYYADRLLVSLSLPFVHSEGARWLPVQVVRYNVALTHDFLVMGNIRALHFAL